MKKESGVKKVSGLNSPLNGIPGGFQYVPKSLFCNAFWNEANDHPLGCLMYHLVDFGFIFKQDFE